MISDLACPLRRSGDIGTITKEGALKIVDRKKNIFKLSQGERRGIDSEGDWTSEQLSNSSVRSSFCLYHTTPQSQPAPARLQPTLTDPTPSGEYIAVEKLESVYKKNLLVEQVWALVVRKGFKNSLNY